MSTTPNMSLVLPDVSTTPGPAWASLIVSAFDAVDEHDHTAGSGKRIVSNAINIDGDLTFNSHKAKSLELATFVDLASFPTGAADVRGVLSRNGDIYWNNGSGIAVQLTAGNRVNVGPVTGTNSFGYRGVSTGNLTIATSDTFSYVDVDTTSARTVFLPSVAGVTGGRYFIVKDRTGNASTGSITLTPNGGDTIEGVGAGSFTINGDFDCYAVVANGTGSWRLMHLYDGEFERGNIYRPATGIRFQGLVTGESLFSDPLRFGASTMTVTASSQLSNPQAFAHQVVHLIGTASADTTITVPGQSGWAKLVCNSLTGTNNQNTTSLTLSGSSIVVPEDAFVPVWTSGSAGDVRLYGGFNSRTMPRGLRNSFVTWLKFDELSGSTSFRNHGNTAAAENGSQDFVVASGSADIAYPGIQRLCVRFDGVNRNVIASPNDGLNPAIPQGGFRFSTWIRPFWNNSDAKIIFSKAVDSATPTLTVGLTASGTMSGALYGEFTTYDAGSPVTKVVISPVHVELGGWNHVGATYNNVDQTFRLWLNGCNVVSRLLTSSLNNDSTSGRMMVGGMLQSTASPFCGFIDDLRFELSSSQTGLSNPGNPATFANASRYFADAYRRGMGFFDDVGAYGP